MESIEPDDIEIGIGSSEEDLPELPQWDNMPTVALMKRDLEEAKSSHDTHVENVNGWLDYLNITGSVKRKKTGKRSVHVPQVIRKHAEWRYSSLSEPFLSTRDIFNIDPITFEDKKAAEQNALVLNNQLNTKINKVAFINEFVNTAVDEGTVIIRVGWDNREEEEEVEVPTYGFQATQDPNMVGMLQQLGSNPQALQQAPPEIQQAFQFTQATGVPQAPYQNGTRTEVQTKVVKNCPTLEICDYKNLILDPSAEGNTEEAKFVIYSFATSIADLTEDGRYFNLDNINVENASILGDPDHETKDDSNFNFNDKKRKLFVAYEYWGDWDINDDGILKPIVATWVGNTLIRLEENPYPDKKHPFVVVQYLPKRKSNYGEPDGALLKENQDIIGATTRAMIDILGRTANGQQGVAKDALDVTNRRKYMNGDDYEFNPNSRPEMAFYTHTSPEIPQSAHFMLQLQNSDAESLTGVKAFSGASGITGAALGENVGGIKSALDATAKRELGILRRLGEGMKQIGRKIISMNAVFLSDVEVIRITNTEFVPVKRDDLAGNFDLDLTISTAEADEQKASELAFMLQTMGNNMDPAMSRMILADIATLRKMPTLAKKIEEYEPQPDPLEVKKAELEVALLEAQVATERSKAIENHANAALDNAKARTEGSTADKTDLDFVEQESGTTQARELEKSSEQARGNMALEAVKHEFKKREEKAKPKSA